MDWGRIVGVLLIGRVSHVAVRAPTSPRPIKATSEIARNVPQAATGTNQVSETISGVTGVTRLTTPGRRQSPATAASRNGGSI
jgi:hypothetical protein